MGIYTSEEKKEISREMSKRYKIRNREEANVPNELKGYHRKLRNAITILEEILLKKKELAEAVDACGFRRKVKIEKLLDNLEASTVNIFTAIRFLNTATKEFDSSSKTDSL
jgi:predicted transcriptional regulator